jgi:hypothetical protein
MLKKVALVFGMVLLTIGILGFVPPLAPNDKLLGIFKVDGMHNIIHILSGIAALIASKSEAYASTYFKVFGVVYALVMVVGFIQGDEVLGLITINMADNLLHLLIAGSSLYLGFGVKPEVSAAA